MSAHVQLTGQVGVYLSTLMRRLAAIADVEIMVLKINRFCRPAKNTALVRFSITHRLSILAATPAAVAVVGGMTFLLPVHLA